MKVNTDNELEHIRQILPLITRETADKGSASSFADTLQDVVDRQASDKPGIETLDRDQLRMLAEMVSIQMGYSVLNSLGGHDRESEDSSPVTLFSGLSPYSSARSIELENLGETSPKSSSYGQGAHEFDSVIDRASQRYGVDSSLIRSVISAESGFDPQASSPKGAMGLMQLMPDTARVLGVKDAYDPEQNIRGGAKYLRDMLRKFGAVEKALAAYNAGPAAVVYYEGVPPFRETQDYIAKIRRFYTEYTGKSL